MIRVTIENSEKNQTWTAEFKTQASAESWLAEQTGKPGRLPERIRPASELSPDEIATAIEVFPPGTYQVDGVVFEEEMVRLPAEFTSSITDITAEVQERQLKSLVESSIQFGHKILTEFAAENIALGITSDNMTKTVRQRTNQVVEALQTGSLIDAIDEIRSIPEESKDPKFITNSRLLSFINKIEQHLEMPVSESL